MVKAKRLIFDVKTMEQREEEFEFTPQISRDILKKEVERETERYISEKLAELDEDFVDLVSEYLHYLSKTELSDYELQRKMFIEAVFDWKEQVWKEEEALEMELDTLPNEDILEKIHDRERAIIESRLKAKLADKWGEVQNLKT